MEAECLREWKIVVDNLMTQDHVTFRDLLSRVHTSTTSGVVNIFTSIEQVRLQSGYVFCLGVTAILLSESVLVGTHEILSRPSRKYILC